MTANQKYLQRKNRTKVLVTTIVTVFIFSFLLWEHFNGGVASHHILHQQNLPAISNWWSGLLLPILTWLLISRTEMRISKQSSHEKGTKNIKSKVLVLFTAGLSLGVLISISFANGYSLFLDNVLYIILLISLIIPIYYSEFILGFILGMTYTFGAILPTVFILILAAVGIISYKFIRPMILKLFMRFSNNLNRSQNR
jgi:hypothetical protein